MEGINILSSPDLNYKPGEMWRTPARSKIRVMRAAGKSYGEIKKLTGLEWSTIQGIIKGPSFRTTRKGKTFKLTLLKKSDIQRIFRFVSESWTNRTKSWVRIKAELFLEAY